MNIHYFRATPEKYIKEIDGLRAIAVSLVLIFHAFPDHLRGGFVGVDVFFVISGYLITSIIDRANEANNFSLARFLVRRIVRLLPAMLMVSGAVLLFGAIWILPQDYANIADENLFADTFTANIFYLFHTRYSDIAAGQRFFIHYWSLAVEMQLYILWAVLAFFSKQKFPAVVAIVGIASFFFSVLATVHHASATFYLPLSRVWEFSLGAAVFYAHQKKYAPDALVRYSSAVSFFGLALVLLAAYAFNLKTSYPGWRAAIPVFGAALIVYGATFDGVARRILSHATLSLTGRISYGIYLWHWPILAFIGALDIDGNSNLARSIGLAAAIVISAVVYPIESSVRSALNRSLPRAWLLVVPLALLMGASLLVLAGQGLPWRFDGAAGAPLLRELREKIQAARSDTASYPLATCIIDRELPASARPKFCTQAPAKDKTIVVWGDSHAAHIMPGLVARFNDYRIVPLGQAGCPPLAEWSDKNAPYCLQNNLANLEAVKAQRPALVILVANWTDYTFADVKRGLLEFIKSLKKAGATNVVVMGPAPNWKKTLPAVIEETILRDNEIPNRLSHGLNRAIFSTDNALSTAIAGQGAEYVSILDGICASRSCPVLTPAGDLMALDTSHFTAAGSIYLIEVLEPAIRAVLRKSPNP